MPNISAITATNSARLKLLLEKTRNECVFPIPGFKIKT